MLSFVWWLIIGVVAGGLARLLLPGRQPMSLMMTMILGLAGSLVGGFVASMMYRYSAADTAFQPSGLIGSTIGAFLLLAAYVAFAHRGSVARP